MTENCEQNVIGKHLPFFMKKIREFNLVCMNVTYSSKKADFTEFFGENFYYLSTLRQENELNTRPTNNEFILTYYVPTLLLHVQLHIFSSN